MGGGWRRAPVLTGAKPTVWFSTQPCAHVFDHAAGMFLLLILWCINTLQIHCTDQPLQWSRYAEPTFHSIFTSQQNALSLFLTQAPIVRIKSSEHKLKLFRNTQVIDISKLSLASHNLKRSVSLLRKQELVFKSSFHTCSTSSPSIYTSQNAC